MKKGYQEDPNFNYMDRYYLMMKKLGYMLKRHTQTSSAILLIHFMCVAGMKNLLLAAMKVLML